MKLEYNGQDFPETQISSFIKISPVGVVPCVRTDGQEEANSRSLQFCERVYKLLEF